MMMDVKTMLLVNQRPQSSLVSHRNAVFLTLWEMFTVRFAIAHPNLARAGQLRCTLPITSCWAS